MNTQNKTLFTLTTIEKASAQELGDQIYSVLCDAESASFMVSEMWNRFFGDEWSPETPVGRDHIMLTFEDARQQFIILTDYMAAVRDSLRFLYASGSENESK